MKRKETVLVLMILFLLLGQGSIANAQYIDFPSALKDYSLAVSGDKAITNFDIGIQSLINDRIQWYNEYFRKGLNSELIKVNSEFIHDGIQRQGKNTIIVQELVTLTGKPLIQIVEDHPSIKSLRLALTKNQDQTLAPMIEAELNGFLESVQSSIDAESFSISWINNHKITFDPITGQMIKDDYSSYARGDDGNDVIVWGDTGFRRKKIDLSQMPDYILNHTPIELMADEWLNYFGEQEGNSINYTYNRTTAATYINRWVTNTTSRCQTAPVIVTQNIGDYNPAYGWWICADCANYVSQALYAGGLP